MVQNKALILKEIPTEWPEKGKHLVVEATDLDLNQEPPKGGVTLKNYYVSYDPYQRGRMRAPEVKSYSAPFQVGKPITNRGISKILKSDSADFKPGDVVVSRQGTDFAEYQIVQADGVQGLIKLENPYNLDVKIFIGALGMPGLTAWSSFYAIGEPKKGETIFISAASGAVGQLVGQLAKHEGLKVFGSVGDDKKLDFITKELKFDGGFNYKKEKPSEALSRLAPDGIDIYYDNVGGEQLEASINAMKPFGRIIACGMISQYNVKPAEHYAFRNLTQIVTKRLKIQGFIVGDANMGPVYFKEHQEKLQKWIADGSFKAQMSVTKGMDNSVDGLLGIFRGENFGKAVLEIADLESDK